MVSWLKARHLWVDGLWIIQDDVSTKQAMMSSMDFVSGHAFLAVIAATIEIVKPGIIY